MSETARFQETLRRLAIVDEAFVGNQAGLGLHPAGTLALDTKTMSLLQLAVLVATGSPGDLPGMAHGPGHDRGPTDDEIAAEYASCHAFLPVVVSLQAKPPCDLAGDWYGRGRTLVRGDCR